MDHVGHASDRLGIDEHGLDPVERSAVTLLIERGRPIGRESLAARLGVDLETFREVHEPFLERAGLMERTESGRIATRKAHEIYGGEPESEKRRRAEVFRVLDEAIPRLWSSA